jgi:hypothetical protein
MGTSSAPRTALLAPVAVLAAIGAMTAAFAAARGPSGMTSSQGYRHATISSGAATLTYPSSWKAIPGDSGTVSFATRGRDGLYRGYLNVTPRQGPEQLAGWAAFRTRRNAEDGDTQVRELRVSENVSFIRARGSCVVDDYVSRVGAHPYRELACIVAGRHTTSVFVGAALVSDWPTLGPVVRRAAATLIER